ncbi:hypothetical protein AB0M46_05650 [Dactylosporangium sp. NPDC051485]|uniref:hypothetical protein n=1 Tax=Dactylosporangium sp. NPDC051485 TaxID=3154846 RepID=UPI00341B11C7
MTSTAGPEHTDTTTPAANTNRHVARHAAPQGQHRHTRAAAEHALHMGKHVAALVGLHVAALGVIDKTPLLALLSLH